THAAATARANDQRGDDRDGKRATCDLPLRPVDDLTRATPVWEAPPTVLRPQMEPVLAAILGDEPTRRLGRSLQGPRSLALPFARMEDWRRWDTRPVGRTSTPAGPNGIWAAARSGRPSCCSSSPSGSS